MECLYCAAALPPELAAEHYARLHRERLAAAAEYRRLVDAGEPAPDARARANAMVRRVLEQGPGRYVRAAK